MNPVALASLTDREKAVVDQILKGNGLVDFMTAFWHVVEPATPLVDGWHIHAIAEHLEAVSAGQIRNLIVNIPPRCMKSTLVSVLWFAWTWTWRPETRWLYSSYAADLAIRDSVKCRRLIDSAPYQAAYGNVFELASDQNVKSRFDNTKTGVRMAVGVGGGGTGEGGDFVVVDDPHKVLEAESAPVREGVVRWWTETMTTRGNDPKTSSKVIVMQRVHARDLTGYLLKNQPGDYVHLCLPMRFEEQRRCFTSIGWVDPRKSEGELLWPDRFDEPEVATLERTLGQYAAAGQLQQRPAPRGGGKFKRAWFKLRQEAPVVVSKTVIYVDKAGTEDGGAYTAIGMFSVDADNLVWVEGMVRAQVGDLARATLIDSTIKNWRRRRPNARVYIEQEPGSGGKDTVLADIRRLAGIPVTPDSPSGDKVIRATPYATYAEAGNVVLLDADWNEGYLDELEGFPTGEYKDQVDVSSGAFNLLFRTGTLGQILTSGQEEEDDEF